MTWYENTPRATYSFLDRAGTIASFDLYYALNADRDSLWAAIKLEDRFLQITDCTFFQRSLTVGAGFAGGPEPSALNLQSGIFVLRSALDTYTSIVIPGLRTDLLVEETCFVGQKIDMAHPDVVALAAGMLDAELVTERGDPIVACSSGGAFNTWFDLDRRSG